jgi:hypothetical protein
MSAFRLFIGELYNASKRSEGAQAGNKNASKRLAQSEPVESTADKLAADYGVSRATVKRAGADAAALEDARAWRHQVAHLRI